MLDELNEVTIGVVLDEHNEVEVPIVLDEHNELVMGVARAAAPVVESTSGVAHPAYCMHRSPQHTLPMPMPASGFGTSASMRGSSTCASESIVL